MSIYVVTHKDIDIVLPSEYRRIIVNAKNKKIEGELYDCYGDNISNKNYSYCELTAIYYIWKNVNHDDYVGIDHYRRFFAFNDQLLNKKDVENILEKNDIILPKKIHFWRKVGDQYCATCGYKSDLLKIEKAIQTIAPEYLETYKKVLNSHYMYAYNMFVMKRDDFNDYCEWLFEILFELEKTIDASKRNGYFRRVFGFIAERLLNVYVLYKEYNIYEVSVRYIGEKVTLDSKIKSKVKKIYDKYRGMQL